MCGIAGLFGSKFPEVEQVKIVEKMTVALSHRGPDGSGIYSSQHFTAGHRRLAIVDTSDDGRQPMRRHDVILTYNGELYNFMAERKALESKGHRFSSLTDTEVILALYEEYGLEFIHRLDGIFAFALYDSRRNLLVCARDPFGIKPFLYWKGSAGFLFASELKSMLNSGLVERRVDRQALKSLLVKGSVPQPLSIVDGVRWLRAGQMLVIENGRERLTNYFRIGELADARRPVSVGEFEHELTQSVHEQMVADVSLGAFLSGGIDSSLIVALMKIKQADVKTFSVGFSSVHAGQKSEASEAREVARFLNTDHHEFMVNDSEVQNLLRPFVRGLDHPSIDGMNSFLVSRAAAKELRVALSGTGADEYLAGYAWFENMVEHAGKRRREQMIDLVRGRNFINFYDGLHRVFSENEARQLTGEVENVQRLENVFSGLDVLTRTSGLVMQDYLRNQLLADIDTTSMSQGLEVRVPYLKPSLVKLGIGLPPELKRGKPRIDFPEGSYAQTGLKAVLSAIGEKYLPREFFRRSKNGFNLPIHAWVTTIWNDELHEQLGDESTRKRSLFAPELVRDVLQGFLRGNRPWTQVWLLLIIELWCQEVLFDDPAKN